jgi:hypothetical protein
MVSFDRYVKIVDIAYKRANKIGTKCRSTFQTSFRSADRSMLGGSRELRELEGLASSGRPPSSKPF